MLRIGFTPAGNPKVVLFIVVFQPVNVG